MDEQETTGNKLPSLPVRAPKEGRKLGNSRPSLVYNHSMAAALRLWGTVEVHDRFLLERVAAGLRELDPPESEVRRAH